MYRSRLPRIQSLQARLPTLIQSTTVQGQTDSPRHLLNLLSIAVFYDACFLLYMLRCLLRVRSLHCLYALPPCPSRLFFLPSSDVLEQGSFTPQSSQTLRRGRIRTALIPPELTLLFFPLLSARLTSPLLSSTSPDLLRSRLVRGSRAYWCT